MYVLHKIAENKTYYFLTTLTVKEIIGVNVAE